jgi:hypothetical protein
MGSLWVPKPVILEAWRVYFGTLGDRLGDPGVPGDTPQDTLGSRSGFLSILGGFWDPLGIHFGVTFVIFRDLGKQSCSTGSRVDFLVIWGWNVTGLRWLYVLKP